MSAQTEKRVAVITGASAGIGKAAAKELARRGWHVIGVGRDPERTTAAEAEIRAAAPAAKVDMIRAELTSLAETARAAAEIAARTDRIDALLNNAGGVVAERRSNPEGIEATFAGNHLSPFLLTARLMPLLEKTARKQGPGAVRIIATSSSGHEHCAGMNWDDLGFRDGYVGGQAYCQAKLANLLFTHELARRVQAAGIVVHAMHPGVVDSNFASHCEPQMQAYMDSQKDRANTPEQAAETLVWLASDVEPGRSTGRYWHRKQDVAPAAQARDDEQARRLWEVSEAMIAAAEQARAGAYATG
jgi:NAD(P)-dependent dehydrogenase (short-subunit alcohol dehydrogenase family)